MKKVTKLLAAIFVFAATLSAHEEIIKGQMLVQFREPYRYQISTGTTRTGLAAVDNLNQRFRVSKIEKLITDPSLRNEQPDFGLDRLYRFYFPADLNSNEVVDAYRRLDEVEAAWPNRALPVFDKPNDPRYGWHLDKCHLSEAWGTSHGDKSIVVCSIDNGVEWTHEDIQANLWINSKEDINHDGKFTDADKNGVDDDGNGKVDDVIGWNFKHDNPDPYPDIIDPFFCSHGTNTLGVAVGVTNNGKGIASPGWNCRGMVVNCDYDNAHIDAGLAIKGIQYAAANGAKIISMSFGGYGINEYSGVLRYAKQKGCLNFGAAGNENTSTISYPGGDTNALAVAASNLNDRKSSYSNYGDWVDLCAPGDNIVTTMLDNYYETVEGTSIACPVAAGIAALVWAAHPTWKNSQVQEAILSTCDSMPDPLYSQHKLGNGRINAASAIVAVVAAPESSPMASPIGALQTYPNPFRQTTTVRYQLTAAARVSVKVYDRTGTIVRIVTDELKPAGSYSVRWDGRDDNQRPVLAGVYFFRLEANGRSFLTKAVLVK